MKEGWKIYTRTGDQGETSLIGGSRVPKYHMRIEAYGTLDELNSFIGYLADQIGDGHFHEVLTHIQDRIFTSESLLAMDPAVQITQKIPGIFEDDVLLLEKEMDLMNESLPELTSFIIPGGHPLVSLCHICRTITRRAERIALKLASEGEFSNELVLKYLNRLSDYFFVLARKLAHDQNIPDVLWKAKFDS